MISNKILIVDDEIEIIELLETVLKHEGFSHIFHATTGTEALSLLKACLLYTSPSPRDRG